MAANTVSENRTAKRYVHSTADDLFILHLTVASSMLIIVLTSSAASRLRAFGQNWRKSGPAETRGTGGFRAVRVNEANDG